MTQEQEDKKVLDEIERKGYARVNELFPTYNTDTWDIIAYRVIRDANYSLDRHGSHNMYRVVKNSNYALEQSLLKTNESVRKVNSLFWATIIISSFSLAASLAGVYVQLQQLQVQIRKDISAPKPIEVQITRPLKVDFPLIKDTVIVKPVK